MWSSRRSSFTHVSTHQTYVGKALYEHAPNCATIAAVACMSSSLLKSSLGPNLLALIRVEYGTFHLFDKIFLEYNPHMQLTQKLDVLSRDFANRSIGAQNSENLIEKLKSNGPLFSSSLLQANIDSKCLLLLEGFRALRTLTLAGVVGDEHLAVLKSLPSLSDLKMGFCSSFGENFFETLGDLENNKNLNSLEIDNSCDRTWNSEGFQKYFCGRLLAKNRLTKFVLNGNCWRHMNEADQEAFVNAGMTNLVELRNEVPANLIRGEGFGNLRILAVRASSDDDLVNIGNHCLSLEVLIVEDLRKSITGSFLSNEKLDPDAFARIRGLGGLNFSAARNGVSRLSSLEEFSINRGPSLGEGGSFLQYLPNPLLLRSISVYCKNFNVSQLWRFVNLKEVELQNLQLSREDILSFTLFKELKKIILTNCGEHVASSEPFRILCPQLPNLQELHCFGAHEKSRWTDQDVEGILTQCNYLRNVYIHFPQDGHWMSRDRKSELNKKYPSVNFFGTLQNNPIQQESGSRREREE